MNWLKAIAYGLAVYALGLWGGHSWGYGDALQLNEEAYRQGKQDGQISIIQGIQQGKIRVNVPQVPEA